MAPVEARILEKVKKCLALSSSANAAEAAAAMARAQEMMAKYGISAEALSEKVTAAEVVQEDLRSCASATRLKSWELRLYHAIAEAFGCTLLFKRGMDPHLVKSLGMRDRERYATYIFVGVKDEAQMARYAGEVLQRQLQRGRATFTRDLPVGLERGEKTREVDAYCEGWVFGATTKLQSMLDAKRRAAEQAEERGEAQPGTALMVVSQEERKQQAIAEYMAAHSSKVDAKVNKRRGGSEEARLQGYADGLQAEVHRPITDGCGDESQGALREDN